MSHLSATPQLQAKMSKISFLYGESCFFAYIAPNGAEVQVFGEPCGLLHLASVLEQWLEYLQPGDTLKVTVREGEVDEAFVHTFNPDVWRPAVVGGVDRGEGYLRFTARLT